ncbi:hypothetical protein FO519_000145 [Halicephalobus sp. NKZ332]|nr:hypothetical protein FO519_000145 [Halicephalobus sp. NKZ332]
MTFRFVFFGALLIGITVAGPIGLRDDVTQSPQNPDGDSSISTSTSAIAVVDTLNLTHKLMDKQAALIRQYESSSETTTTTEAPVVLSNAQIDAFGRPYSNIAFADLTNLYKVPENLPQYQEENLY